MGMDKSSWCLNSYANIWLKVKIYCVEWKMQQNESASVVCNKAVECEWKLHKSPGVFQLLCLCLQLTIDQDQGFSLLKPGLLISVFFLIWLNINRSFQYQSRCLLVKNFMALLPWKKHSWETSNYSLGVRGFLDSCTVKTAVLPTCRKRGARFPFPPNVFVFWTCDLMFKQRQRAGN